MVEASVTMGQLRWRCRRGTKELDRVLGEYLQQDYTQASSSQQTAFRALLEVQDPDIYDWLMGTRVPDEEILNMIIRILQEKYAIARS